MEISVLGRRSGQSGWLVSDPIDVPRSMGMGWVGGARMVGEGVSFVCLNSSVGRMSTGAFAAVVIRTNIT